MEFGIVFEKIIQLFLIILIGYAANKLHILNRNMREVLTEFVLNIALPCMILGAVWGQTEYPERRHYLFLFCLVLLWFVLAIVVAKAGTRILRFPAGKRGVMEFCTVFPNVGFMGYPVIEAIFGTKGLLYAALYSIPFNAIVMSYGVMVLIKDKKVLMQEEDPAQKPVTGKNFRKIFLSPVILAAFAGFIFSLAHLHVPAVIGDTADMIGKITTPASMLITGSSLAEMRLRDIFKGRDVYLITMMRLAVMPLITLVLLRLIIRDDLFIGVTTVLAGMPAAAVGQMLCVRYQVNEDLMARACFLTTLGIIITIPLLALLVT